ncbi:MAG: type IVB secretion system protein IcmH/DotU [Arcobacteraceae bacterium]|nr:type IVB secretion system protein IcmH/DotU [Arcobacteraceae bacterium]MDY0327720.1 type IVB secretion system protein IcmH/DotU [Arcobacteraceae bacterium]
MDNKTVLVPLSQGENKLTNFSSNNSLLNQQSSLSQQYQKQFFKSLNTNDSIYSQNALVVFAKPIFKKIDILLKTYSISNIHEIHDELVDLIDQFTIKAESNKIINSQVYIARYLLCTFLDELISTTFWGKNQEWSHNSLLVYYYKETYGGEKFFQLLNKLLVAPAENINLLEFMYICISLGFEGKYRIQAKGKMELDMIRENLYKQIKITSLKNNTKFYTQRNSTYHQENFFYKASYWLISGISTLCLVLLYSIFSLALNYDEENLYTNIEKERIRLEVGQARLTMAPQEVLTLNTKDTDETKNSKIIK